jgi:ribokinase
MGLGTDRDHSSARTSWPQVVVVGGASTDFIAYGPRLPGPGDEFRADRFLQLPGGKGANQALAVARLGGTAGLIARVGRDLRGQAVLDHLRSEGIDIDWCVKDSEWPTSAIVLMVGGDGTKQTLTVPGATGALARDDVARAEPLIRHAELVLVQFEPEADTVLYAIELAARMGRRVLLDAGGAPAVPRESWRQVYLVRANAKEACALTGIEVGDAASAKQAARWFLDHGVRVAAVDAGGEGNILTWDDGDVRLPRMSVATIDKTGAGDAFIAGLAVGLLDGRPWPAAGWFANAAAALTTTRLGAEAGIPRRTDVLALLERAGHRLPD